jgi:glycosyltransferase involved in cell wall biosynthesis
MSQRIKLLLIIPHLGGGGAEKVTSELACRLDPGHFEIHLCLIAEDSPGAPSIPTWVRVHRFHSGRIRRAWFKLLKLVRAEQPDVLLSNMAHLNFLVLLLRPILPAHTRILVRQNTTASSSAQTWLSRLAYRYLYPRADAILSQSQAMAGDLAGNFAIEPAKLHILANPIDIAAIRAPIDSRPTNPPDDHSEATWPNLLAVGRLAPEKGMDVLLRALPLLRLRYPQIRLQLIGSGLEETALRQLSTGLKLNDIVTFAGYRQELSNFYAQATLFVLPSRYEGMPNALLEAAAAGLPIVATPCSAGLVDLLRDAPGTWLSKAISSDSLTETILTALITLSGSDRQPQRFGHAFLEPFELNRAIAAYAALIQRFAAQPCSKQV